MTTSPYRLFLLAGLCLTLQACQKKQQDTTHTADSATATGQPVAPNVDYAPEPMPAQLAELGLTRDSHWRGINLGDPFSAVGEHEAGKPFEQDAQHVGYTVDFKNLESADMLYYQQSGKVSRIEVDLFLNSRAAVQTYTRELTPYFSTRYGTPATSAGTTTWLGTDGARVTLKDVSKGKDFGLKITFSPQNGGATASAR